MGGQRGRLIAVENKAAAISLIQEACQAGSRRKLACELLSITVRTLERWEREKDLADRRCGPITQPANKLTEAERTQVLEAANSAEYCNLPPSQIVPKLADKGIYIASESSFYRILKQENQLTHRGISRAKKHHKPAELIATQPNQVWSWDITYLPTLIAGKFFYLYLFLDIFSRKIVGFDIFEEESAEHAASVVSKTYIEEGVQAGEVALHSDNGSPMKGCTMLAMLQKLGIMSSFSRPSVSNDNPFSESLFKTLKYCPQYPSKPFASIEDAKAWVINFVYWYNNLHQHSGINFVTPMARHQGLDKTILEDRVRVYEIARQRHPNRWSRKIRNWEAVGPVYLNPKHTLKAA